jgi:hypothetical protein
MEKRSSCQDQIDKFARRPPHEIPTTQPPSFDARRRLKTIHEARESPFWAQAAGFLPGYPGLWQSHSWSAGLWALVY